MHAVALHLGPEAADLRKERVVRIRGARVAVEVEGRGGDRLGVSVVEGGQVRVRERLQQADLGRRLSRQALALALGVPDDLPADLDDPALELGAVEADFDALWQQAQAASPSLAGTVREPKMV